MERSEITYVDQDAMEQSVGKNHRHVVKARELNGIAEISVDWGSLTISIRGESREAVQSAKDYLWFTTDTVLVPQVMAGKVIGKGGARINRIIRESEVHSISHKDRGVVVVFEVIGTRKNIRIAREMINACFLKSRQSGGPVPTEQHPAPRSNPDAGLKLKVKACEDSHFSRGPVPTEQHPAPRSNPDAELKLKVEACEDRHFSRGPVPTEQHPAPRSNPDAGLKLKVEACEDSHFSRGPAPTEQHPAPRSNPDAGLRPASTTSFISRRCKAVGVGQRVSVRVFGEMSPQGAFWAQLLPKGSWIEDLMMLSEHEFALLTSPKTGDYCAVKYSRGQRWYRGRVLAAPERGKVSVFFIDYGETDNVPLSSLATLDNEYIMLPPQVIRCCFSADKRVISRETKWQFNDMTHYSPLLTAHLLQQNQAPLEEGGVKYVVLLTDESAEQPVDIGATVMALSEVSQERQGSIKYHDIRYKNQPLPNARQISSRQEAAAPPVQLMKLV